jgi:hypothetical protein
MEAKEKAIELVNRFIFIDDGSKFQLITIEDEKKAINCALIAVDEIMDLLYKLDSGEIYYWESVKREIYNL